MKPKTVIKLGIALVMAGLILGLILSAVDVVVFEDGSYLVGRQVGDGVWSVWDSGCIPFQLCGK